MFPKLLVRLCQPTLILCLLSLLAAYTIYKEVPPHYISTQRPILDWEQYASRNAPEIEKSDTSHKINESSQDSLIKNAIPFERSLANPKYLEGLNQGHLTPPTIPAESKQLVYKWEGKPGEGSSGKTKQYYEIELKHHYGLFSLYPALIAILFCWLTREPLISLFLASITGAIMLGSFDYIEGLLLPVFMSQNAALILILYLWLLGGLLGIWTRTGAAQAFANWVTKHFVSGPNSARFVTWFLGILFFQGGTVSTVLVGTTVKPLADRQKVSHEELSYIVDSTASPIACLIAFNAWPAYIQAFLYVPGVVFLANESERLAFFFRSLPLSFYAIFAVIGTLLFSFDKLPLVGRRMKAAQKRARTTGELDAPGAMPLHAPTMQIEKIDSKASGAYQPSHWEFIIPLFILLGTAIITFIVSGSPKVHLAFGIALLWSGVVALLRGLKLKELIHAYGDGCKSVLMGALILLFALVIGQVTAQAGGGHNLVDLLGSSIPYWLLPLTLLALTILIAFSTGTSWGTYAVVYPLAMPLAWAIASGGGITSPELYLSLCFAVVLNGSVIGDQSSPISDTTILSSMCTGCDLMDHVKTQIVPVAWATLLATISWTIVAFACA